MDDQWKPIETAPKDGTNFILSNGKFVEVGYYSETLEYWD